MNQKILTGQAIILAAGESSRFWPLNYQPKSLFRIMGRPLICHTIEGLKKSGIGEVIIIQGPKKDVEEELKNYDLGVNIKYIVQPEPKGMGEAVARAQELISGSFFVVGGHRVDAGDYVSKMMKRNKEVVLLGIPTNQPWHYGILKIEGNEVKDLIEKPAKGQEPSNLKIGAIYLLPPTFFEHHKGLTENHYSFEQVLKLYIKESKVGLAEVQEDFSSLKYPWHLFSITKYLFNKKLGKKVQMGKNVKILKGAVIKGPCYIGDNSIVGNNAIVRDYTNLEEGAVVGAQAEVARCIFEKNAHVHSGYFGDTVLGEGCRVGAGTVTGNVRLDRREIKETGLKSLGIIVGKNSHIGINASLMPGVLIGSDCQIGPSTLVFENIEDKTEIYTEVKNIVKKQK